METTGKVKGILMATCQHCGRDTRVTFRGETAPAEDPNPRRVVTPKVAFSAEAFARTCNQCGRLSKDPLPEQPDGDRLCESCAWEKRLATETAGDRAYGHSSTTWS